MRRLLTIILLSISVATISAQNTYRIATDSIVRPVASAYSLEYGSSDLRDTYLTPLNYSGWSVALNYERMQAMSFAPDDWIMRLDGRLSFASTENPGHTASMMSINLRPSWSMLRRFKLDKKFAIAVGGNVGINIGALYLMRNSNNPAAVQASATIGLTAMATYSHTFGKLPVTLRYQPTMPLTGVFFAPDYDELYYEIWLGNHNGLCHAAWPGNFFRLDNLLTADLHLGSTILRVGYRCEISSSKASHIVSQRIEHSFVLGVSTEWLSLQPGSRRCDQARIISSMY